MTFAQRDTDHGYYPRDPIIKRPGIAWPNSARIACAVVISVEYYEMQPQENAFIPPTVPGGFGRGPYPDFRVYSSRAYGSRVGIFRLLEALDHYRVPATVALDSLTVQHCGALLPHLSKQKCEIVGHGQSITRVISSRMSEAEERDYIATSLATIERATGTRPLGWHGPEYGESSRTPALLAELGCTYVLDWPNDEQPIALATPAGPLVSVPMLIDFDDVYAHFQRKITAARWRRAVEEGVEELLSRKDYTGRVLVLNLHPWLMGHPFRIGHVEDLLAHLARQSGLWLTTAGAIASWWRDHMPAA